jgi:hypothetical protein
VPLSFSPIRSEALAREVSNVLLVLESVGTKMLRLEEVVSDQLEAEGNVLVENVLTFFQSRDLVVSLDPVVLRPTIETKEVTRSCVQEAAKIMAA